MLSDDAERMGFTYSGIALTNLPHKLPKADIWRREGPILTWRCRWVAWAGGKGPRRSRTIQDFREEGTADARHFPAPGPAPRCGA